MITLTVVAARLRYGEISPIIAVGRFALVVLAWAPHLKVFHEHGRYMDEYRMKAGKVEVRALDANGDPYPGYSEWLRVTPEEIKLHFLRHTEVAQWLKKMLAEPVTSSERSGRRKAG